jgi:hypothetical protein
VGGKPPTRIHPFSSKNQAPSTKYQATSNKQQATSNKQQATSNQSQANQLLLRQENGH